MPEVVGKRMVMVMAMRKRVVRVREMRQGVESWDVLDIS